MRLNKGQKRNIGKRDERKQKNSITIEKETLMKQDEKLYAPQTTYGIIYILLCY